MLDQFLKSKITILGLGTENIQFLNWLLKVARVDSKNLILADKHEIDFEALGFLANDFGKIYEGSDYLDHLQESDYVVKAPGIWSLLPEIQEFRKLKGEDRVISSLTFFIQKFQNQIIGVTGTKGKSTTSNLTSYILNQLKIKNYYCGNTTGISPYKYWTKLNQKVDDDLYYVLELSSFQLQDLGYTKTSPKYGIITNYYLDHQDQHASPKEYWNAKNNLFLNAKEGSFFVANVQIEDKIPTSYSWMHFVDSQEVQQTLQEYDPKIVGEHNFWNLTLALQMAMHIFAVEKRLPNKNQIKNVLQKLPLLPSRQEIFHETDFKNLSTTFIDDGYATEPDAVVEAIKTFTDHGKLVILFTGKDKGGNLKEIIKTLEEYAGQIEGIWCFSEVGKKIYTILNKKEEFTGKLKYNASFKKFVQIVLKNEVGKIQALMQKSTSRNKNHKLNVVLSPGGSSFDEFENAKQRSDWFKEIILEKFS